MRRRRRGKQCARTIIQSAAQTTLFISSDTQSGNTRRDSQARCSETDIMGVVVQDLLQGRFDLFCCIINHLVDCNRRFI